MYAEKNPAAIEEAAKKGRIMVFELEDLESEDPSLVTDAAWRAAYAREIPLRVRQAADGFRYAAGFLNGHFEDSVLCLKDAEQRMKEAGNRRYETDFSVFHDGIASICKAVTDNFRGSRTLLSYLEGCGFDVQKYRVEVEANLPRLAQQYANRVLKMSRRTAKRLIKTVRSGENWAEKLKRDFERVEELRPFGVDADYKISAIKDVAYRRGVEFLLAKSREYAATDGEKSARLYRRAERNANALGMEFPGR